ncbi:hypothetical protein Vretimale_13363 [Volvox reticuliferus]|uniref:Uncharacterized protein n=1 Tax=Volvox reticuliferus TaxID=1737510 RepID=A0A8J4FV56_9CHLO|nr:hypothetical protein Vretifemale_13994 [Volvox reticuliferus]GIM09535.1 hypothetical protein Vretimale_13363 [Volvox reticuliferus]
MEEYSSWHQTAGRTRGPQFRSDEVAELPPLRPAPHPEATTTAICAHPTVVGREDPPSASISSGSDAKSLSKSQVEWQGIPDKSSAMGDMQSTRSTWGSLPHMQPPQQQQPPPDIFRPWQLIREMGFSVICLFVPLLLVALPNMWQQRPQQQQQDNLGLITQRLGWQQRPQQFVPAAAAAAASSCEVQRAAGWLLPDFPCGSAFLQQVRHVLSAPCFYWLSRPLAMEDWVVLLWYGTHLTVIFFTGTLLVGGALTVVTQLAPPPPATAVGTGGITAPGKHPHVVNAIATATAAAVASVATIATARMRRAWAAYREPLMLMSAPYKCGMAQLLYGIAWVLYYGSTRSEKWYVTYVGALEVATQSRPWVFVIVALGSAACHKVRTRMLTLVATCAGSAALAFEFLVHRMLGRVPEPAPLRALYLPTVHRSAPLHSSGQLRQVLPILLMYGAPIMYVNAPAMLYVLRGSYFLRGLNKSMTWYRWRCGGLWFRNVVSEANEREPTAQERCTDGGPASGGRETASRHEPTPSKYQLQTQQHGPTSSACGENPPTAAVGALESTAVTATAAAAAVPTRAPATDKPAAAAAAAEAVARHKAVSIGYYRGGDNRVGAPQEDTSTALTGGGTTTATATNASLTAVSRPVSVLYASPYPCRKSTLVANTKYKIPAGMSYDEAAAALRAAVMRKLAETLVAATTAGPPLRQPVTAAGSGVTVDQRSPDPVTTSVAAAPRPSPYHNPALGAALNGLSPGVLTSSAVRCSAAARIPGPQGGVREAAAEGQLDCMVRSQNHSSGGGLSTSTTTSAEAAAVAAAAAAAADSPLLWHIDCLTLPGCVQLVAVLRYAARGGEGDVRGCSSTNSGGGEAACDGGVWAASPPGELSGLVRELRQRVSAAAEMLGVREMPQGENPRRRSSHASAEAAVTTAAAVAAEEVRVADGGGGGAVANAAASTTGYDVYDTSAPLYVTPAVLPYSDTDADELESVNDCCVCLCVPWDLLKACGVSDPAWQPGLPTPLLTPQPSAASACLTGTSSSVSAIASSLPLPRGLVVVAAISGAESAAVIVYPEEGLVAAIGGAVATSDPFQSCPASGSEFEFELEFKNESVLPKTDSEERSQRLAATPGICLRLSLPSDLLLRLIDSTERGRPMGHLSGRSGAAPEARMQVAGKSTSSTDSAEYQQSTLNEEGSSRGGDGAGGDSSWGSAKDDWGKPLVGGGPEVGGGGECSGGGGGEERSDGSEGAGGEEGGGGDGGSGRGAREDVEPAQSSAAEAGVSSGGHRGHGWEGGSADMRQDEGAGSGRRGAARRLAAPYSGVPNRRPPTLLALHLLYMPSPLQPPPPSSPPPSPQRHPVSDSPPAPPPAPDLAPAGRQDVRGLIPPSASTISSSRALFEDVPLAESTPPESRPPESTPPESLRHESQRQGSFPAIPAQWLGCVPLLVAPVGPAEELQELWERTMMELQERRVGEELAEQSGALSELRAALRTALLPLGQGYATHGSQWPQDVRLGNIIRHRCGHSYSSAAGIAFRDHFVPLLEDIAAVAISAAPPPRPPSPSPGSEPYVAEEVGGSGRHTAAGVVESEMQGSLGASYLGPGAVPLLRNHVLEYLESLGLILCVDWLAGRGGVNGDGGGLSARMQPPVVEPDTSTSSLAETARSASPSQEDLTGECTSELLAAEDATCGVTAAMEGVLQRLRVAAPQQRRYGVGLGILAAVYHDVVHFLRPAAAALHAAGGFSDAQLEEAYVDWHITQAPRGWAPLAAGVTVGAVGVLVTKLRLDRYGIDQPLAKALAGMLWLLSPMGGQYIRLGLLTMLLKRTNRLRVNGPRGPDAAVLTLPAAAATQPAAAMTAAAGGATTLSWYDTLAAACTGLLASVLGLVTYTCRRPELDVRQDEAGFVFGIFAGRSVFPPLATQLRPVAQVLVSVGMAAVDLVHVHVLWGGGVVRPALLAAAVAAVAAVNLAVSAVLDVQQRKEFARRRCAAKM